MNEELEEAHAKAEAATIRADEAEAAANAAAEAAVSAISLARQEVGEASAAFTAELEERCHAAEQALAEQQKAVRVKEAEKAARRVERSSSPVQAFVFQQQAEASRVQVMQHELRVLGDKYAELDQRHAQLLTRAAVFRRRAGLPDGDGDEAGPEGLWWPHADEATETESERRIAYVKERRRKLAEALLVWYVGTRRVGRR